MIRLRPKRGCSPRHCTTCPRAIVSAYGKTSARRFISWRRSPRSRPWPQMIRIPALSRLSSPRDGMNRPGDSVGIVCREPCANSAPPSRNCAGTPITPRLSTAEADAVPLDTARDCFLVGTQLAQRNRHRDALGHLERATRIDPENYSAWFVRGSSHLALEQYEFAAMCYGACISLRPKTLRPGRTAASPSWDCASTRTPSRTSTAPSNFSRRRPRH